MKNTGKEYEKLTQNIFSQILNQTAVNTIEVKHDVILQGITTTHQIDVYWEFDFSGIKYRTIIQAKDWKNKVPQKEMLAFKAIIDDLPSGTKGIYVSKSGYQSGAVEVAKKHGISIFCLREPSDDDWDGMIKTIELNFNIKSPVYKDLSVEFDGEWFKTNVPNYKDYVDGKTFDANSVLYDDSGKKLYVLKDIIRKLISQSPEGSTKQIYEFENNVYLNLNDKVKAKVLNLSGEFGYKIYHQTLKIDGGELIGWILKDIIEDTTFRFDKQQKLIGGNDNEQ